MGRNGCGKEDALHILKNASNSRKIKLRDLAARPSLPRFGSK
ncbi:ANTAR domain-containing protein [Arthrobacter sp. CAU 1506]|nr:ANTAR domain-containing protein [Arthrobacter sp. CAU 1506]